MSDSEQYVYILSDPRDGIIHYVGITKQPNRRLKAHLKSDKSNPLKDIWIAQLQSEGIAPLMEIIETVGDRTTAEEREHYWMEYYWDNGMPLTNISYAPYHDVSTLWNAIEQERIRRVSFPDDAPGRWIERMLEKDNLGPFRELIELTPIVISKLLYHAITGSPLTVDRAVRILVTHIKLLFPYLEQLEQLLSLHESIIAIAYQTGQSPNEIALNVLTQVGRGRLERLTHR